MKKLISETAVAFQPFSLFFIPYSEDTADYQPHPEEFCPLPIPIHLGRHGIATLHPSALTIYYSRGGIEERF